MSHIPEHVWVSKLTGTIVGEEGFIPVDLESWEQFKLLPVAPPRDGEKLPRLFRWKNSRGEFLYGVRLPIGAFVESLGGVSESWVSYNESEIEWID